jgi:hypothetical protein
MGPRTLRSTIAVARFLREDMFLASSKRAPLESLTNSFHICPSSQRERSELAYAHG